MKDLIKLVFDGAIAEGLILIISFSNIQTVWQLILQTLVAIIIIYKIYQDAKKSKSKDKNKESN